MVDGSSFKMDVLISTPGTPVKVWIARMDDSSESEENEASNKDLGSKAPMENGQHLEGIGVVVEGEVICRHCL